MFSTSLFPESGQPFALSPRQRRIYEGLCAIREDIGQFYFSALELMSASYQTKAHLIAHLCREIDGGLRDVLELKEEKDKRQAKQKELIDSLAPEIDGKEKKDFRGHIASILTSLGVDNPDEFARKWVAVATQFASFAHRNSRTQSARDIAEFEYLWNEYESILDYLVGTYYKRLDLIDRLLLYDTPPAYALDSLRHQVKDQTVSRYFFTKLDKPSWLVPLQQAGFFERSSIPDWLETAPGSYTYPGWPQIFYLRRMALEFPETHSRLREIVGALIVDGLLRGEEYSIDYMNVSLPEIMMAILGEGFPEEYTKFIAEVMLKENSMQTSFFLEGAVFPALITRGLEKEFYEILKTLLKPDTKQGRVGEFYMGNHEILHSIEDHLPAIAAWKPDLFLQAIEEIISKNPDIEHDTQFHFRSHVVRDGRHSLANGGGRLLSYLAGTLLAEASSDEVIQIWTSRWLHADAAILKAAAVYSIECHYESLAHLFWSYPQNPLSSLPRQEVYSLLHTCYPAFTEDQWQQLLAWIEALEQEEWEENPQFVASRRKEWLHAVLPSGRAEVTEVFERYHEIYPKEIENPGFDSSVHLMPVPLISPISYEAFLLKSNASLAEEILAFDGPDSSWDDKPDRRGLTETFRKAFRQQPEKFLTDLMPFVSLPADMLLTMLWEINGQWRDGKPGGHLMETLEFLAIVAAQAPTGHSDEAQVWARTAGFICERLEVKDGVVIEDLPIIQRILLSLSTKTASRKRKPIEAPLDIQDLINEAPPLILSALIWYAVRRAALLQLPEGERWEPELRRATLDFLLAGEGNPDLYGAIGRWLPQLCYLDGEWVKAHTHILLPENRTLLEATLTGYLSFVRSVDYEVFNLLKDTGGFHAALEGNVLISDRRQQFRLRESLVQVVCVAFLMGWDSLRDADGLLQKICNTQDPELITYAVRYFATHGELYPVLYSFFSDRIIWDSPDWRGCHDEMVLWALCDDKLTAENVAWVKRAVKDGAASSWRFQEAMKKLEHHAQQSIAAVGDILFLLVEAAAKRSETYEIESQKEAIIRIVKKLFLHRQTENALKICSAVGQMGFHFLRPVEEEYGEYANPPMNDWYAELYASYPDAILCMHSAWANHDLSTFIPRGFHIYSLQGIQNPMPAYMNVQVWPTTEAQARIGIIETLMPDGSVVRMTDLERSVCDAVLHESSIGADLFSEVLNDYFNSKRKRNINKIIEYSKILNISHQFEPYLKVLI